MIERAATSRAITSDFVAAITGKAVERRKTVAEYFDAWPDNARAHLAPHTVTKYAQLVREFKEHTKADAAPVLMDDVTADQVREWLMQKRKATSAATVKGFRRILSSIFLQAQNEGQTARNPVALAKLPKMARETNGKRAFTLAEVRDLHDKASLFWKWMIQLAFYTGFALGDCVTLRRVNVDLRQKTINILRRKTKTPVKVPFGLSLHKMFRAHWPQQDEDFFWPDQAERYLNRGGSTQFSDEFHDLMAKCGFVELRPRCHMTKGPGRNAKRKLPGVGFHCLRHTFVTNLKVAGASDSVAKELAGHGSAAISAVYTHLPTDTLANAVKALPEITEMKEIKQ